MKDLRNLKDFDDTRCILSATNKLQDGGTHLATLLVDGKTSSTLERQRSRALRFHVINPPSLGCPDHLQVDMCYMEKGIQNSHGARPVNQDIQSMWWTRTSRLSIKNSLFLTCWAAGICLVEVLPVHCAPRFVHPRPPCSGIRWRQALSRPHPQPSTINPQPSTIHPQPSTPNPDPCNFG